MCKLHKIIVFIFIFILINQSKLLAEMNFNASYYSNKNIYKNEYKININRKFFDDKINIGGYIKQNTVNKNRFKKYLNNNNYYFNLQRKFAINDNENYFYKLYLNLKIADFFYKSLDYLNNSIFLNISYFNNIKYYKLLKLTFVNDIYERYGVGLNYLLNNNNKFTNNFYIDYIINKNNIKNTLNIGFSSQKILNDSIVLFFNYDYSKDFNNKDNKQHILNYKHINITYYYKDIMNEAHSFNLSSIIKLDEFLDFTIGFSYIINKNYDNSFGVNFNIGF